MGTCLFRQNEEKEAGLSSVPGKAGPVHLAVLMSVRSLGMLVWTC